MTRFLYLADTHLGSSSTGYKVQPKYGDKLPELLDCLKTWMDENGPFDFVLHGGDIIHETDEASIRAATDLFDFGIPVHLCVGNHDLTVTGAIQEWMALAPGFFRDSPEYSIKTDDCTIQVIPNQYGEEPYRWDKTQDAHFLDHQIAAFGENVKSDPDSVHILATHSPVVAIPPEQVGHSDPFHAPHERFTKSVTELAENYRLSCVLGAHSHANMNKELNGVNYITVSSFVETPFEFKLFEVDSNNLSMRTCNLINQIGFPAEYNWDKTFAQGRSCDRALNKSLS